MRARRLPSSLCGVAAVAECVGRAVLAAVVVDSMRLVACLMMPGSQLARAELNRAAAPRGRHAPRSASASAVKKAGPPDVVRRCPCQHGNKHAYLDDIKREILAILLVSIPAMFILPLYTSLHDNVDHFVNTVLFIG